MIALNKNHNLYTRAFKRNFVVEGSKYSTNNYFPKDQKSGKVYLNKTHLTNRSNK